MNLSAPNDRSGKKALDAELNLVPFIDLLVCCVCFLLLTSVWVQLASLPVSQRHPGPGAGSATAGPLTLLVADEGYVLTRAGQRWVIPRRGSLYDDRELALELRRAREVSVGDPALTISAEDGIRYSSLVRAMDVARQESFTDLQLSDSRRTL